MPLSTDLDQMQSDMVRALHAWWMAARRPNGLPDRADFDPAAFKPLLPHLIIVAVETDPFRIRYRLVGTKVVDYTGFEFTGRYLDELGPSEAAGYWQDCYRTTYESRRPFLGAMTEPTTTGDTFTYEFGFFPVSLDEDVQIMVVEDYFGFELTATTLRPWLT